MAGFDVFLIVLYWSWLIRNTRHHATKFFFQWWSVYLTIMWIYLHRKNHSKWIWCIFLVFLFLLVRSRVCLRMFLSWDYQLVLFFLSFRKFQLPSVILKFVLFFESFEHILSVALYGESVCFTNRSYLEVHYSFYSLLSNSNFINSYFHFPSTLEKVTG